MKACHSALSQVFNGAIKSLSEDISSTGQMNTISKTDNWFVP